MANIRFDDEFTEKDYVDTVRKDFTRRAPEYSSERNGQMREEVIKVLLNAYPPSYPLLDIACGTGLVAVQAGRNGAGVTGLDLTPAMLDEARKLSPQGTFVQGRAESLPFPDNTFSSAYTCNALVYFTDVPKCLREAYRVLKPGGFLAYQAVTLDSYITGVALEHSLVQALGKERGYDIFQLPHDITDTDEANRELLGNAGFVDIVTKSDTQYSFLSADDASKFWGGITMSNNGLMGKVKRLGPEELENAKREFIAFLEARRDVNDMIQDKVTSWYVRGKKPMY